MTSSPGAIRPDPPECVRRARALVTDPALGAIRDWKAAAPDRRVAGCLPIYTPRELLHAAGVLAFGLHTTGDRSRTWRGDAWVQSYVCHLPRTVMAFAESGLLDVVDALVVPSTCDVIRNLRGVFQLRRPTLPSWYLEVPHTLAGVPLLEEQLRALWLGLGELTGRGAGSDAPARLRASIRLHNRRRALLRRLDRLRATRLVPAVDVFHTMAAGDVLPVEEHLELLRAHVEHLEREAPPLGAGHLPVVLRGCACEQPSARLLSAVQRAGCAVVDDDLDLGLRWPVADVDEASADPIAALAAAAFRHAPATPSLLDRDGTAAAEPARRARTAGAAVVLAAPSFCDIALLDRPRVQHACDAAGIPHTALEFSEDGSALRGLGEQLGTFADSIRLWRRP